MSDVLKKILVVKRCGDDSSMMLSGDCARSNPAEIQGPIVGDLLSSQRCISSKMDYVLIRRW